MVQISIQVNVRFCKNDQWLCLLNLVINSFIIAITITVTGTYYFTFNTHNFIVVESQIIMWDFIVEVIAIEDTTTTIIIVVIKDYIKFLIKAFASLIADCMATAAEMES